MRKFSNTYRDHSGGDRTLPILVQILFAVAPIQFLMVFAGDTQLTVGMVMSALVGCLGAVAFASSHIGLSLKSDRPLFYMSSYLLVCAVSIVATTYGEPAVAKGLTNLFAMLAMLAMVLLVVRMVEVSPDLFGHLARIYMIAAGLGGASGVFQSFVSNVLDAPSLFNLTPLSVLLSGRDWWVASSEGSLVRAQGLYEEPSHVIAYLGPALGLSIMRLGLVGLKWREALNRVVPVWAAFSVLFCILLTFSTVCYAALLVTFVASLLAFRRFGVRTLLVLFFLTSAAIGVVALIVLNIASGVSERLADLAVLAQVGNADQTVGASPVNFSVAILFLNAEVALQNVLANPLFGAGLGAHPFAYDALVRGYYWIAPATIGYSSQDASSLFLRVVSETGISGIVTLTAAIGSAYWRARRITLRLMDKNAGPELTALSIALSASLVGLYVAFLIHIPNYYATPIWLLFALVTAIPGVAQANRTAHHTAQQTS